MQIEKTELEKMVRSIASEIKLKLEILESSNRSVTISAIDKVTLPKHRNPISAEIRFTVKIAMIESDLVQTKQTIKMKILEARNNLRGEIGDEYDPEYNPTLPSVKQLLKSMGHNRT